MRHSYNPSIGPLPTNGQTYRGYGTHGQYGYDTSLLGYSHVPPAYTMTRDFRREEKRGLREAKKEARRDRKLARKNGADSYYAHSNLPLEQSYGPYRDSRHSYPAGGAMPMHIHDHHHDHRGSYDAPYGATIATNHPSYWDPTGSKRLSIEPCPCTNPAFPYTQTGFPYSAGVHEPLPAPVMSSPVYRPSPIMSSRPIFDESIYQPHQPALGRSSYLPVGDERLLPSHRVGGHYGLIAPATNEYMPAYSPANPIDWRKISGL